MQSARGSSSNSVAIVLVQFNSSFSSRSFFDHGSLDEALNNLCALYEKELQVLNPAMTNITYDVADLYTYLDALHNVSLLLCVRCAL
mgnify:CR=1 FL=1